ncbi:MAG: sensor protein KdpD [Clostridium sp.]|uniref:sensor protein KdpD n=2 Tax=Clostridiaceae TaxID=31979 RepID=UPI00215346BF|nr:universal stress protein [Clostridium sp. LY3-2]MCR6514157.1 universal stress protein [Clostridium sp. LY3-2]
MGEDRLTPLEALNLCKEQRCGKLKIFLGYAPGVGKTFTMLNEANRRLSRGEDVVIGYLETHGRKATLEQVKNLPIIPRKKINYKSLILEEMDVDEIILRKPHLVLIDELAHTNVKGSKNNKRYEDVFEILNSGINVHTTVNLQHIESLNDVISGITGIQVKETIPDKVFYKAEVVVIDITPKTLINRLSRGNIYNKNLIQNALKNFFREGNLNALRELTLRQLADDVDESLVAYKENHKIDENWRTAERIMVNISSNPTAKRLIRTGARMAKRYKCEFYVVYVNSTRFFSNKKSEAELLSLKENIDLAKKFDASIIELNGKSISNEIIKFAKKKNITKIILGHSRRTTLEKVLYGSPVNRLLSKAKNIELIILPYP